MTSFRFFPNWLLCLTLWLWVAACSAATPTLAPSTTPSPTPQNTLTPAPLPTATPTFTPTLTPTPPPTVTPTPTPTPDPFAALTIDGLSARTYGGGELQIKEGYGSNASFTRTLIAYPSDGLTIYGFMNVPRNAGSYPVVIVLHGYINPAIYNTIAYTTRYADALARAGYLVIHPNLRGYPPSDGGPNPYRVGMAIDVLNLIALIKQQAGKEGPLQKANANAIGLWGHSMGGGISTRVMVVNADVRAVVLYGAVSGNEGENAKRFPANAIDVPADTLQKISAVNYFERVTAAVSIHHSDADPTVPIEWSRDTCERLQQLRKRVECFTYNGLPHTFNGEGDQLFMQRVQAFFDAHLKH